VTLSGLAFTTSRSQILSKVLQAAHKFMPWRAEPLYEIAKWHDSQISNCSRVAACETQHHLMAYLHGKEVRAAACTLLSMCCHVLQGACCHCASAQLRASGMAATLVGACLQSARSTLMAAIDIWRLWVHQTIPEVEGLRAVQAMELPLPNNDMLFVDVKVRGLRGSN
jgi:hypothetical protein